MPKKDKQQRLVIDCRYGKWILSRRGGRNGIFQADGRSNPVSFGRHSLGTRDLNEAKELVHDLDLRMAVNKGLAERRLLNNQPGRKLTIETGLTAYRKHIKRPREADGPKEETQKRYERSLKSFESFSIEKAIRFFEQLNADCLNNYATWRASGDVTQNRKACKESTVCNELGLILRCHRHLIEEGYLNPKCAFRYKVRKPKESSRYCPTPDELHAILRMTSADPKHRWLHNATLLISYSGTRLSEAANLTWADIEFANSEGEGFIHVRDESFLSESARSTKNGYSRKIPIHPSLAPVLKSLYEHNSTGRVVGGPRGGKLRSDKFGDSLREVALVPLAKTIRHERFQTITAHCFRHFFASICAASNLSQQTVMDWMGQRSDSMAKHYFHRNDEASLRNIKKIEPIFDVSTERTDDTLSTPDETEVAA